MPIHSQGLQGILMPIPVAQGVYDANTKKMLVPFGVDFQ